MNPGISIVICCYNSADRLSPTLAHLAAQQVTGVPWEIILVDNASTDNTAEVARSLWQSDYLAPLRVVHEPQPGLSSARRRGVQEASYDIVSFVDDDNWVCPEWVQTIAEIMAQHPEVGACGSRSEVVSTVPPPAWFTEYQSYYAVGDQASTAGDVTEKGVLWGAGLSIRKPVWNAIFQQGFQQILSDRIGSSLMSAGDFELCLAIRAAGWRLWYDPRLSLRHCLPVSRLQWSYLRRLKRGMGCSSVGLDPYFALAEGDMQGWGDRLKQIWLVRIVLTLLKLLRYALKLPQFWQSHEGDPDILEIELLIGRLTQLLQQRQTYRSSFDVVQNAPWRNRDQSLCRI